MSLVLLLQNVFSYQNLTFTLVAYLFVRFVVNFYLNVYKFPRGPFPWPLIGNIHYLLYFSHINKGRNPNWILSKLNEKYGPVFTLWIGLEPVVVIANGEGLKETFWKSAASSKPEYYMSRFFTDYKGHNIIFSNGSVWKSLRHVAALAVRKFANSDSLPHLVSKSIENTLELIKAKEGLDKPFEVNHYVEKLIVNLIAAIAFGKNYSMNDPEFIYLNNLFKNFNQIDALALADVLPKFLQTPFAKLFGNSTSTALQNMNKVCQKELRRHFDDYKNGVIRDFSDSMIAARKEAIEEGKDMSVHLTEHNLGNVISDLFFAGIDTTLYIMEWMFLIMSKHPDIQMKMRQEIKDQIGDRLPVQDDKNSCHYTMAFICETMRMRVFPFFGMPHLTTSDLTIFGYPIPEGTTLIGYAFAIHHDLKNWLEPTKFDPNRFLDSNGKQIVNKPSSWVPFGVGRRSCVGERLAMNDMFLILARMFQLTDGQKFVLVEGSDSLDFDEKTVHFCKSKPFKIKMINCDKNSIRK